MTKATAPYVSSILSLLNSIYIIVSYTYYAFSFIVFILFSQVIANFGPYTYALSSDYIVAFYLFMAPGQ